MELPSMFYRSPYRKKGRNNEASHYNLSYQVARWKAFFPASRTCKCPRALAEPERLNLAFFRETKKLNRLRKELTIIKRYHLKFVQLHELVCMLSQTRAINSGDCFWIFSYLRVVFVLLLFCLAVLFVMIGFRNPSNFFSFLLNMQQGTVSCLFYTIYRRSEITCVKQTAGVVICEPCR